MPIAFLLALQASGMVVDWLGTNEQVRLGKMGNQIEQAGINSNIATARLQSEDESLQSMRQLRKNLGTQAAVLAARGVRSGTSTSALISNESVGNFNSDERMRKINQLANEASLKAGRTLSDLHQQTSQNNDWNSFKNSVTKRFPTSPSAWREIGKGFSKENSYGFSSVGS